MATQMFYQTKKRSNESVTEWRARIKNLASKCKLLLELFIFIRDIYLKGMDTENVQVCQLKEDALSLSTNYSSLVKCTTTKKKLPLKLKTIEKRSKSISITRGSFKSPDQPIVINYR